MAGGKAWRWLWLAVPLLTILGLSVWAVDKPNVTWRSAPGDLASLTPLCPLCRTEVRLYARRCPTCQQDIEWVVAPKEDSPICPSCLTPGEAEALAARRKALGEEASTDRVGKAIGVTAGAARTWLSEIGPGACGWCGGSGSDLSSEKKQECPVCFGEDECIGCAGTRRMTVGYEDADVRMRRYERTVAGLGSEIPVVRARDAVREANEDFLAKDAGTREAQSLLFWPSYRETPLLAASGARLTGFEGQPRAVDRARERIVRVLQALQD